MGYDTELIFIAVNNDLKGYQTIVATLEMKGINYGHMADLISWSHVPDKDGKLSAKVSAYERQHKRCYNSGDHTDLLKLMSEAERKAETDKLRKMDGELEKMLCYIYHMDNGHVSYEDRVGDLLMVVSLDALREALIKSQAEAITNGEYKMGYRRFDMALRMVDMFLDRNVWGKEPVKVVLWGH